MLDIVSEPSIESAPLILTLQIDPDADRYFTKLREALFPAHRNIVPAHITLFHHLPGPEIAAITTELQQVAASCLAFPVSVTGLRNLGRGVAYALDAPTLHALRAHLVAAWSSWLTPQDRQKFKPHLTVQNKVSSTDAHLTYFALQSHFKAHEVTATGLNLWRYLDGPWQHLRTFPFPPEDQPPNPDPQPTC